MSRSRLFTAPLLLSLALLLGCEPGEPPVTLLDPPEPGETLRVATRNAATTSYLDRHETPTGPEHDLVQRFAEAHGWAVEWSLQGSTAEVLEALASYNIGRGHLLDARQLARELGRNPGSWEDMKAVLPLKADKRYYPQTRYGYGYARGYEPVHYVQRIRNYQDVIGAAVETSTDERFQTKSRAAPH